MISVSILTSSCWDEHLRPEACCSAVAELMAVPTEWFLQRWQAGQQIKECKLERFTQENILISNEECSIFVECRILNTFSKYC